MWQASTALRYRASGSVHTMRERLAKNAEQPGANVRLRKVAETAPDGAVSSSSAWAEHHDATKDRQPAA